MSKKKPKKTQDACERCGASSVLPSGVIASVRVKGKILCGPCLREWGSLVDLVFADWMKRGKP